VQGTLQCCPLAARAMLHLTAAAASNAAAGKAQARYFWGSLCYAALAWPRLANDASCCWLGLANCGGAGDLWLWRLIGARKFTWISCGGTALIQML
jgi:hypothetical protein